MQEQQYEGSSSGSEIVHRSQGMYDVWSEGEKLRPESQRQKAKGRVSPLVIAVIVIVVLFVVILLFGIGAYVMVAHGAVHSTIQQAIPAPIQNP
jgi:hypothetical protein